MKLLQPSEIHIENIKFPASKPRDQHATVMQQAFFSEIESSI